MNVSKLISESWETYERTVDLVWPLGLLVLLVSSFLMLTSTYISGGAGFVKYLDVMYSNITSAVIILLVSVTGLFMFAFLSVGASAVVKYRRTLDDLSFVKLANRAVKYSVRVSVGWFFLGLASFIIGVVFEYLNVPSIFLVLTFLVLWWGAIFLPQTIVLEDLSFTRGFAKSIKYSIKYWPHVLFYYLLAALFIFLIILSEVALEQMPYFYWTAPFISGILLFLIVVPFLEILKCEFYLAKKYKITSAGLK